MDKQFTQKIQELGINEKESSVLLTLAEFGLQPASVVAKKLRIPRPTALFLLNRLAERGLITKSKKGKTQLFFADLDNFEQVLIQEANRKIQAAEFIKNELSTKVNPLTKRPKIRFYEGIEGCKFAYSLVAQSKTEVREFGRHEDLEIMGKDFMAEFIKQRVKNQIFIKDLSVDNELNQQFQRLDKLQFRDLRLFNEKIGSVHSSICVFEDKVLILNLHDDAFAILIESTALSESIKTLHELAWKNQ